MCQNLLHVASQSQTEIADHDKKLLLLLVLAVLSSGAALPSQWAGGMILQQGATPAAVLHCRGISCGARHTGDAHHGCAGGRQQPGRRPPCHCCGRGAGRCRLHPGCSCGQQHGTSHMFFKCAMWVLALQQYHWSLAGMAALLRMLTPLSIVVSGGLPRTGARGGLAVGAGAVHAGGGAAGAPAQPVRTRGAHAPDRQVQLHSMT